ncbi:serine hydrolase FSH [Hypoxylon fuscum]|nr:serine hydrolase FSH [Hypoxylon fuscum]
MRILCLHGDNQGETASDLASLSSKLQHSNANVSFDFADGPLECSSLSADNSTHCKFSKTRETQGIREAHEWLAKKLDHDGTYDGVLAYSQGASLVSSFLVYRQWYHHELPPPFKFAVFISGEIPLQVLKDLGVPVSKAAEGVVAQADVQRDRGLGPLLAHATKARRAVFDSDDCFGLNLNRIPLELKIRIPTVHVWGDKDPLFPTSVHLAGLCDPYIRKIHVHSGAHEIPREEKDSTELASLIEWCMQRATWPGQTQL